MGFHNAGVCNITNLSLGIQFKRKSTGTKSTMEIGSVGTLKVMYGNDFTYTLSCENMDDDEYEFYSVYTTSTGRTKKWKEITLPYGWVLPCVRVQNHVATVLEPGHVTGISDILYNVSKTDSSSGTYDLQGRKVNDTNRPGIYIQNGRKIIRQQRNCKSRHIVVSPGSQKKAFGVCFMEKTSIIKDKNEVFGTFVFYKR